MATTYYRVQPAGLDLDHRSESSDGETSDGLHVFLSPHEAAELSAGLPEAYGDEVVILVGDDWEDNEDCEGVLVDGEAAQIVHRVPWAEFRGLWDRCRAEHVREFDARTEFADLVAERWPVES